MRQGTTPTYEIELEEPIDVSSVKNAKVTFSYQGEVILQKYLCDCEFDGKVFSLTLTQKETFMFEAHTIIKIQLRIVTVGGEALATDEYDDFVDRCLDDEELV